ncbi:MAG TPA: ClpX C4-type zinc finger protein [Blastocatellia bacterium]
MSRLQQPPNRKNTSHCSFCQKAQSKVDKLFIGPHRDIICNECVDICNKIIEDDRRWGTP